MEKKLRIMETFFLISGGHVENSKRAFMYPYNINRLVCLSNWLNMDTYATKDFILEWIKLILV